MVVQVESQFSCRRITSQQTKFDHVVSSLAPEYAAEVRDLLLHPPVDNQYDTLKAQLTKRTSASEQKKLQLLLTPEELGNRKPTQLLRRMQHLMGNRPGLADESLLRELFLHRLPPNIRMVLAATPEGTKLEQLAELADKVMEVAGPTPPGIIAGVASPLTKEVESLRDDVARLEKLLQKQAHSRSYSRSPSRYPRSPSRLSRRPPTPPPNSSSNSSRESESLCWYHSKFGQSAQKCRAPCTWQSNPRAGH